MITFAPATGQKTIGSTTCSSPPSVLTALVGLGLERSCAGCGAQDWMLCPACRATLSGEPFVAWPTPCPAGLPPPSAIAAYDGAVRAILLAHKEGGRLGLVGPLGAALARSVAGIADSDDVLLVPVPSRRSTVRSRGHDATLRTARVAAGRLRADRRRVRVLPVLRPTRRLLDQAGLSSDRRLENLAGALTVPPAYSAALAGRHVVVVDDVITTGSTLAESVRAIAHRGVASVSVAVIAATVRRGVPAVS